MTYLFIKFPDIRSITFKLIRVLKNSSPGTLHESNKTITNTFKLMHFRVQTNKTAEFMPLVVVSPFAQPADQLLSFPTPHLLPSLFPHNSPPSNGSKHVRPTQKQESRENWRRAMVRKASFETTRTHQRVKFFAPFWRPKKDLQFGVEHTMIGCI
jgi:hypothetical protein